MFASTPAHALSSARHARAAPLATKRCAPRRDAPRRRRRRADATPRRDRDAIATATPTADGD